MSRSVQRYCCWPIFVTLWLIVGCHSDKDVRQPAPTASARVELQIDFNGSSPNKQFHLVWRSGLTVFDCVEQLQRDGQLTLSSRGSGANTLLLAIDGLENSGAAGDNWIYYVNDRLGDCSAAVCELQPGDRVDWRFGPYEPK